MADCPVYLYFIRARRIPVQFLPPGLSSAAVPRWMYYTANLPTLGNPAHDHVIGLSLLSHMAKVIAILCGTPKAEDNLPALISCRNDSI